MLFRTIVSEITVVGLLTGDLRIRDDYIAADQPQGWGQVPPGHTRIL